MNTNEGGRKIPNPFISTVAVKDLTRLRCISRQRSAVAIKPLGSLGHIMHGEPGGCVARCYRIAIDCHGFVFDDAHISTST